MGGVDRHGRLKVVYEVDRTTLIKTYNENMGGVDRHDRLKVAYEVDRRSKTRFY